MSLLSINDLGIGFRGPMLLDGVSAEVQPGQRIGLLGRNGAGKTTLLRIIDGEIVPDHGTVTRAPQVRVARLTQEVPKDLTGTVHSVVRAGQETPAEEADLWQVEHAVDVMLSKMELDPDIKFETLSSGLKRRVLLARAIATNPEILLLDEPTNHLDIPSILWLENFLSRWDQTLIFITHDRSFLRKLSTRIWEIDRGQLFDWSCDYDTFLARKEAAIAAEEKQNALFDKKLAQEEAWIRQGIKARRTRNEGRVRALKAMRTQRSERRQSEGTAKMQLQQADRSGALVAEVKDISFAYDDQPIVQDFSTTIMRGDKIGIIGRNGAGKTTLLKLLLGQLQPDSGSVKLGTKVEIAYFDQLRDTLDPDKTVQENVAGGSDRVRIGDQTKHVIGYLQDFLFTPERARTEIRFLSGGERNRALLARLMTKPANVIVLDEPTNDLDSETLDLLEEQLVSFAGTVLMVSHDRTFLNNVVTSTLVFEEDNVNEYVGGYDEWQAAVARRELQTSAAPSKSAASKKNAKADQDETKQNAASTDNSRANASSSAATGKLSYNQQRELEQLPARIEKLESQIAALHEAMADPEYYQQSGDAITADAEKLKSLEQELADTYARWEELEG